MTTNNADWSASCVLCLHMRRTFAEDIGYCRAYITTPSGTTTCGCHCVFPATQVTHYGLLTQDARTRCGAEKPSDGPLITTSTWDYVTCDKCLIARPTESQDEGAAESWVATAWENARLQGEPLQAQTGDASMKPIRAHVEGCTKALSVPVDLCECGGRDFLPDTQTGDEDMSVNKADTPLMIVRRALELLLHDVRSVFDSEPPEALIPVHLRAGDVRSARNALRDTVEIAYAQLAPRDESPDPLRAAQGDGVAGWQPIETAPKDGRTVLLWWPYWMREPVTGKWKDGEWESRVKLYPYGTGAPDCEAESEPTHWMPLPDPPRATSDVFNNPERDKSPVPETKSKSSSESSEPSSLPAAELPEPTEKIWIHFRLGQVPRVCNCDGDVEYARVHPHGESYDNAIHRWLEEANKVSHMFREFNWPDRMSFSEAVAEQLTKMTYLGEGEVEAALRELREMFPGEMNIGIVRSGGDGYIANHGRIKLQKERFSIHRRVFDTIGTGATLTEAMQKVREWATTRTAEGERRRI